MKKLDWQARTGWLATGFIAETGDGEYKAKVICFEDGIEARVLRLRSRQAGGRESWETIYVVPDHCRASAAKAACEREINADRKRRADAE